MFKHKMHWHKKQHDNDETHQHSHHHDAREFDAHHRHPFFEIRNLSVHYHSNGETVYAVNNVSLKLREGKTLGLVGETGAGKTTIAKSILRILPEYAVELCEGEVNFQGKNIFDMNSAELQKLRGGNISMIFQDPMTALNPVKTVKEQIAEGYCYHHNCSKMEANRHAIHMLSTVGISSDRADEYPHQFSGGMKQRVVIALALACSPKLIIADEPTTALDVTIQAQVLDLIKDLRDQTGTAMILITHDLGVVADVCDFVDVIYAGRIIESGTKEDIFDHPSHPYTRGLFAALPDLKKNVRRLSPIEGLPPDPTKAIEGCAFYDRCPERCEECLHFNNELFVVSDGHYSLCCKGGAKKCQH